ncbi:hypothetical protein DF186_21010, partial [Enterococcus hirae]
SPCRPLHAEPRLASLLQHRGEALDAVAHEAVRPAAPSPPGGPGHGGGAPRRHRDGRRAGRGTRHRTRGPGADGPGVLRLPGA